MYDYIYILYNKLEMTVKHVIVNNQINSFQHLRKMKPNSRLSQTLFTSPLTSRMCAHNTYLSRSMYHIPWA